MTMMSYNVNWNKKIIVGYMTFKMINERRVELK